MMSTQDCCEKGLPHLVGRPGKVWLAAVACSAILVAIGAISLAGELQDGLVVTRMRDVGPMRGAAWGIYIVAVVYFMGVSFAGITTAALARLFGIAELKPVSRAAEILTVISLLMGAIAVLADLGQPLRGLIYLPVYARPGSPFFGTFSMVVAGYLFASLVYVWLGGRRDAAECARHPGRLARFHRLWAWGYTDTPAEQTRHWRASFWLSLAILPLLVTATSTLGFVFGIQVGRPGWFSALQAPAFVVLAGVSGIGVLIVIAAILRKALHAEKEITIGTFRWLGNCLWVLIVTYLYLTIVEQLTANYAANAHEAHVAHAMWGGKYAPVFWLAVGSLVMALGVLFLQFATRSYHIGLMVTAGILVNVAAILKRFLIVVPSQTAGTLLPYGEGSYVPALAEIFVVAGFFGLGVLLYLVFAKVFPILPVREAPALIDAGQPVDGRRKVLFWSTLATGIALVLVGFYLSAPFGPSTSEAISEPRMPFAPVLFILGLMTSFYSAAVYEVAKGPPERVA